MDVLRPPIPKLPTQGCDKGLLREGLSEEVNGPINIRDPEGCHGGESRVTRFSPVEYMPCVLYKSGEWNTLVGNFGHIQNPIRSHSQSSPLRSRP